MYAMVASMEMRCSKSSVDDQHHCQSAVDDLSTPIRSIDAMVASMEMRPCFTDEHEHRLSRHSYEEHTITIILGSAQWRSGYAILIFIMGSATVA